MQIKFPFEGRDVWTYDPRDIDVTQAMAIKSHTGFGLRDWETACEAVDPAAVQALFWVILRQSGAPARNVSDLNFSVVRLLEAVGEAQQAEAQPAEAPGPTVPTGEPTPTSAN